MDTPNTDPYDSGLGATPGTPLAGSSMTASPPAPGPTNLRVEDDSQTPVTQQAREQTAQVAATAAQQAKETTSAATGAAKDVAATAKEQVAQVTSEATAQARNVASDAKQQLREQARQQTSKVGETLRGLEQQAQALLAGETTEAGAIGDYAQQAVAQIGRIADRVEARGFDGLIDDLQSFARRRPGLFLLGAAAAGLAVGRVARGVKDANSDDSAALDAGDELGMLPSMTGPTGMSDLGTSGLGTSGLGTSGLGTSGPLTGETPTGSLTGGLTSTGHLSSDPLDIPIVPGPVGDPL